MPAKGKHRRTKIRSFTRGIIAASTGGAALALPLMGAATAQAAPAAQPAAVAAPAAAEKSITYSVVAGDSLSKIAAAHSVDGGWKQLYKDNRKAVGDDPSLIHPGLKLTIGATPEAKEKAAPKKADRAVEADRADRSEKKTTLAAKPAAATKKAAAAAKPAYADNLDGWIKESLDIMAQHGIPGTYEGIHRNIMRESSGNPLAINNWDINAINGTPSKGLLQVIQPTFDAYHVPGTSYDLYDPVANITAACNYAADRYGSIDNVNGPY
ncbi:LysM peptidoglycan-binding domain-containing protein [Streptomyces peucetius]|uniref:LysM peptidoglycan-binding domain-containing protein n=1 Tax=Streptomyces peucetius TaxID=1950 RepID=A0ABY6IH51_STRPE|nr:LysM peptidoglycan-binding domain-containing protein [Streptomyces peucetius]UYQ65020.1 LysM peptidoglycan-binding domain-containing protein [Streptomyces peucetius]